MNSLTRRDFLKLSGLGLAGLLTPKKVVEALTPKLEWLRDEVKVGNIQLTPIICEHKEDPWQEVKNEVLNKLNEFDHMICEYLPAEYLGKSNPGLLRFAVRAYDDDNKAFADIQNTMKDSDKSIIVLDPAYSMDGVELRVQDNLHRAVLGTAVAESAIGGAYSILKRKITNETTKVLASAVATNLGAIYVPMRGIGYVLGGNQEEEIDFRHVYVARGLLKLGEMAQENTKMAIVYPPAHWDGNMEVGQDDRRRRGISYYLTHPDDLSEMILQYETKFPETEYSDLYRMREYGSNNGEWEKKMDISVNG